MAVIDCTSFPRYDLSWSIPCRAVILGDINLLVYKGTFKSCLSLLPLETLLVALVKLASAANTLHAASPTGANPSRHPPVILWAVNDPLGHRSFGQPKTIMADEQQLDDS